MDMTKYQCSNCDHIQTGDKDHCVQCGSRNTLMAIPDGVEVENPKENWIDEILNDMEYANEESAKPLPEGSEHDEAIENAFFNMFSSLQRKAEDAAALPTFLQFDPETGHAYFSYVAGDAMNPKYYLLAYSQLGVLIIMQRCDSLPKVRHLKNEMIERGELHH